MYINIKKYITKSFLFLLLILVLDTPKAVAQFAGGSGTEVDPYQVATAAHLDSVRYFLSSHFTQTADIDLGVAPYNLARGWNPIGTASNIFTGSFDGQYYEIQNLTISGGYAEYIGLFGRISSSSQILKVQLKNATVTLSTNYPYFNSTGTLVGRNDGLVEESSATGSVAGDIYVGGLVGGNVGTISKSYTDVRVENNNSITTVYTVSYSAGGIVGNAWGGSTISNSYALGKVYSTGLNSAEGGLVGILFNATILNSYAVGSVYGSYNIEGLVGYKSSGSATITSSFFRDGAVNNAFAKANGTEKTIAELKTFGTYTDAGWDFERDVETKTDQIWDIDNLYQQNNSGYPFLAWQNRDTVSFVPYPPNASNVGIAGLLEKNQTLVASYSYSDPQSVAEAGSELRWYRSDDASGTNKQEIPDASSTTYTLVEADVNKYISFEVVPNNGTDLGIRRESSILGPVTRNTVPTVSDVVITGNFALGDTLNLSYTYTDGQGDPEDGSLIEWYRTTPGISGKSLIADSVTTYRLSVADTTSYISVEITPKDGKEFGILVNSDLYGPVKVFAGGTGTENDPFQISNVVQLQAMNDGTDKHYKLSNNIDASETLNWNSGKGFYPIGFPIYLGFTGTLDGDGFTIDSLYINRTTNSDSNIGLISNASDAVVIKNIGLTNASIRGYTAVGGLVGVMYGGDVIFSFVTGSIRANFSGAGGLMGQLLLGGSIRYSYANVDVYSQYAVGGLASSVTGTNTSIINSYARGNVQATKGGAGGLASSLAGFVVVHNSYASVVVNGSTTGGLFVSAYYSSVFNNTFWDREYSGQTVTGGNKGTSKTTSEMKTLSTFTENNWDFVNESVNGTNNIWNIDASGTINDGYPYLNWQTAGVNSVQDNDVPSASNLSTTGEAKVSKLLKASYDFNDPDGDDESGSTFIWYRSDDYVGNSNKVVIPNVTESFYFTTEDDRGKYIRYEMAPSDGTVTGFIHASSASIVGPIQNSEIPSNTISGSEGWRILSSPSGTSSFSDLLSAIWTQGFPGADSPTGSPNVLTWDEGTRTWSPPSSASDVPASGEGFLVYVYADDDYNGTPDAFPKVLNPSVDEFAGNIAPAITFTDTDSLAGDGWNLVGNPYGEKLDWNSSKGWGRNNIDQTMYVWSDTANAGTGNYLYWNGATGTHPNGEIEPWQGFWVKANAPSPAFSISDSARKSISSLFKMASVSQFEFELSGNGLSDRTIIHFNESAYLGTDTFDAFKLQSLRGDFLAIGTSINENEVMSIQSIPLHSEEDIELALSIDGSDLTGDFQLTWSMKTSQNEYKFYLIDYASERIADLAETDSYSFKLHGKVSKRAKLANTPDFAKPKVVSKTAEKRFKFLITSNALNNNDFFPEVPEVTQLSQNYPNPFNPTTVINYQLTEKSFVKLTVYDMLGRKVSRLVNTEVEAGYHTVPFVAANLASGIYIYRLEAGSNVLTKKMMLIK